MQWHQNGETWFMQVSFLQTLPWSRLSMCELQILRTFSQNKIFVNFEQSCILYIEDKWKNNAIWMTAPLKDSWLTLPLFIFFNLSYRVDRRIFVLELKKYWILLFLELKMSKTTVFWTICERRQFFTVINIFLCQIGSFWQKY